MGIGPGGPEYMSVRAEKVLKQAKAVAGYVTYLDLIRPMISDKQVIASGMRKEVQRVGLALDAVLSGTSCALVCSGDPGVYALASLVFEMCRENGVDITNEGDCGKKAVHVEVVPGIPALCSGAALLGAPLTHDFAAISLSDLLTPWETIEKRLSAAAGADFVIVIYNPKSKKRDWQLDKAKEIILEHRGPDTPVGIVTGAMRENQRVRLTSLGDLDTSAVDMQTTLFIGNSSTFVYQDRMTTPRGYGDKYKLALGE